MYKTLHKNYVISEVGSVILGYVDCRTDEGMGGCLGNLGLER